VIRIFFERFAVFVGLRVLAVGACSGGAAVLRMEICRSTR
jgi:hypothetical protein